MQKYGAACTWKNRLHVVADDNEEIVNPVVTPHSLGPGGIWKSYETVISGIGRIIDPCIARRQRPHRQPRGSRPDPVLSIEPKDERIGARRG